MPGPVSSGRRCVRSFKSWSPNWPLACSLRVVPRPLNPKGNRETACRRTPGNDWAILAFGHPGVIKQVIVYTQHFKGNYPRQLLDPRRIRQRRHRQPDRNPEPVLARTAAQPETERRSRLPATKRVSTRRNRRNAENVRLLMQPVVPEYAT
ncbi:hypothetical protein [Pseudomonas sp. 3A(2025)]